MDLEILLVGQTMRWHCADADLSSPCCNIEKALPCDRSREGQKVGNSLTSLITFRRVQEVRLLPQSSTENFNLTCVHELLYSLSTTTSTIIMASHIKAEHENTAAMQPTSRDHISTLPPELMSEICAYLFPHHDPERDPKSIWNQNEGPPCSHPLDLYVQKALRCAN
jgi:hypothetical protein